MPAGDKFWNIASRLTNPISKSLHRKKYTHKKLKDRENSFFGKTKGKFEFSGMEVPREERKCAGRAA